MLKYIHFALFLVSCSHGKPDPRDYADEAPSILNVAGIYRHADSTRNEQIELIQHPTGQGNGKYFYLSGKNVIKTGNWWYHHPPGKGADYIIGPPGYGLMNFDVWEYPAKESWESYVYFEGEGENRVMVIDSVFPRMHPMTKRAPFRFIKRMPE